MGNEASFPSQLQHDGITYHTTGHFRERFQECYVPTPTIVEDTLSYEHDYPDQNTTSFAESSLNFALFLSGNQQRNGY
jgi:hypothetical protein